MSNITQNKKIAANTFFLYIRMVIIMLVSLYTSRVVLNVLGINDFGIYNVVGGIVVLFSFLNNALTQATQRFLTFELGRQDLNEFRNIFNISVLLYVLLSIIIIVLAETIGLWFLNTQLNIQDNRMVAANWVYQFSIFTFVLGLIRTPYNAVIIAYEKMSFYAYTSIIEALLKLVIVYILVMIACDKLILYSALLLLVSLLMLIVYLCYVFFNFKDCKHEFYWKKSLFKRIAGFSGWSLFGSLAVMSANQGINMLLNIFFGVVVNAAVGISNQVNSAVQQFVSSFQMAFNPQITKSYASQNREYLVHLVFKTSKYSFLLTLLITFPLLFKMEEILILWLGVLPKYTVVFCQLILVSLIFESLSGPLWMLVQATGKIKKYQIWMSSIKWIEIIGAYILLKLGLNPAYVFVIRCVVSVLSLTCRLILLKELISFPSTKYLFDVLFKCGFVSLMTFIALYLLQLIIIRGELFSMILLSLLICLFIVITLGLSKMERQYIYFEFIKKIIK